MTLKFFIFIYYPSILCFSQISLFSSFFSSLSPSLPLLHTDCILLSFVLFTFLLSPSLLLSFPSLPSHVMHPSFSFSFFSFSPPPFFLSSSSSIFFFSLILSPGLYVLQCISLSLFYFLLFFLSFFFLYLLLFSYSFSWPLRTAVHLPFAFLFFIIFSFFLFFLFSLIISPSRY
jgi:hypothetical protein